MGGLPLFFGFLAKEEIYSALGTGTPWAIALTVVAILGNALMLAVGFMVGLKPFIGAKGDIPKKAHEGPPLLWIGPLVLGVSGLVAA